MIIPSIDIYKNKVVRLYKGNVNNIKEYGYYKEYINFYFSVKVKKIHIVLLDNIFFKTKKNILINKKINNQLGGGIYSCNIIKYYLKKNFKKFILGSIVFNNKIEFKRILSLYKKNILISLDCINKKIIINGWIKKTEIFFDIFFLYLIDIGISKIIYTDINKDGTLTGLKNTELEFLINKNKLCKFIISGGVNNFNQLKIFIKKNKFNFIVGLSLYKFTIKIKDLW